ncbi:MAG: phosphoribosyl-ATP diphosphatase [Ottowia sp.]|nr:phosphoribosyl-ATP diphosphatase [Ottowia sp.]
MHDILKKLTEVVEGRHPEQGGDPETSYVARLFAKGDNAILKKIGEEAAEVIMAAKDSRASGLAPPQQALLVGEMADLWFHCMVMLAQFGLRAEQVLEELVRREGLSGLDEQAARKMRTRE